ncbi:MAG: peptide chain release factor N(5)-glutamine methyltransferase [Eubacteriales bacterium]|nr:peptide chain release factor N(5)-glutamine methyltransferase [Eubacteriales bacterium]
MNLREACRTGTERLRAAGIADAVVDARLLLEWAAGISVTEYALNPEKPLTDEQEEAYWSGVEKRCRRIPLQHITGEQEFMGLTFHVNPSVLIPRQDTELLVEEALKRIRPGMRVLDLCTGSGCIAISLERFARREKDFKETNKFTGSDISPEAVATARENGRLHGAQVTFVESDLFEGLEGKYDMIVSNPPYIRTAVIEELEEEVRCHDPVLALDGKEDGLYFYRRIIREAGEYLNDGGWLLFETGHDQKDAVIYLMKQAGYREICAYKDLAGLDRAVAGRYYV